MGLEHFSQQIAGFEKGINHLGTQPKLLLADAIQQVLQNMCCFGEIGEPERPGATLDRVRGAENGVELLRSGFSTSRSSSSPSIAARCSADSSKNTW